MRIKDKIYFVLYGISKNFHRINNFIRNIYIKFLIPAIENYLKKRHPNLIALKLRNSVKAQKNFHFLLSDIDTTLIIKKESETNDIINDFLKIKKYLIMLDFPEIYTEIEYAASQVLKTEKSWGVVNALWLIRKINWKMHELSECKLKFEKFKIQRSITNSLVKIVKKNENTSGIYYKLSQLKFFEEAVGFSNYENQVSTYLDFLSNNNPIGLSITMCNRQFHLFNYLMPGDSSLDELKLEVSHLEYFLECKNAVLEYEKLILRSSIRLNKALGRKSDNQELFLNYLERYYRNKDEQ